MSARKACTEESTHMVTVTYYRDNMSTVTYTCAPVRTFAEALCLYGVVWS